MLNHAVTENRDDFCCFLSDLLGKRVYSPSGEYVGRCSEVVAAMEDVYPEVAGICATRRGNRLSIPIESLNLSDISRRRSIRLEKPPTHFKYSERQFYVRDVLYDRQIVDVNGAKVERVNDVSIKLHEGRPYLAQVDVGFSGLIRRMGFEKGFRRLSRLMNKSPKEKFIDWRFVQPLPESYTSPIHLSLRQEQLQNLHAGELADILEDLDRQERITLVQTIGAENAADALEEAEISVQTSILGDLDTELAGIMNRRLVTVRADEEWEEIAFQFLKLRFKALPVVDAENHPLGIVTFLHSFDELLPHYHKLKG